MITINNDIALKNINFKFFPVSYSTFDQAPSAQVLHLQQQLQLQQQQAHQQRTTGPFGLDPSVMADIEKDWKRVDQMVFQELPTVDISPLYEPLKVSATRDGFQYPQDKFDRLIAQSRHIQQNLISSPTSNTTVHLASGKSPYRSPMRIQQQEQQLPVHMENNDSPK